MKEGRLVLLRRKGAATLLIQAGGQGLMFVAHVLLGRAAGPEGYGVFAYTLAVINLCLVVAKGGQDSVVLRYAPIYAETGRPADLHALIHWGSAFALLGSLFIAGLIVGLRSWWSIDLQLGNALNAGLVALPLLALGAVRSNALMGLGQVVAAQAPEYAIRPFLLIGVAVVALLSGRTLSGPVCVVAFAVAAAIAFVLGSVLLHLALRGMPNRGATTAKPTEWLRVGLWMILVTGAYQAFSQIDLVMVGALLTKEEAGIYAAASRLSVLVQYGLIALQVVVAPQIAVAHATGRMDELQKLLSHLVKLATVFAISASLLLIAFAEPILRLFGAEFVSGSTILRILVLAHVANAITGATGFVLTMTGHQRHVAMIVTLALATSVTLLYCVIPVYGVVGAAWVTVAATAVTHIALAWMAWRMLSVRSWMNVDLFRHQ